MPSYARPGDNLSKILRALPFACLLAGSVALGWRPLVSTFTLALTSEAYTHILLIVPLSCALIYLERETLSVPRRPAVAAGTVLLALALLLGSFVRFESNSWPPDMKIALSMLALVTWWIGCIVFYLGTRTFRALLFPFCFLFWLVPIPAFALDEMIRLLQRQSALAARVLFMAAGVPVTQDGVVLSVPGLDIEIARECSGIRSSVMLMVTTMVLAHLFLRSWWRKALLILAAVPLAAIKNGLRIFTLVQIGTRVDPTIFDSDLHHRGGILFFALSVAITLALLWFLRRTENLESCGPRTASPR